MTLQQRLMLIAIGYPAAAAAIYAISLRSNPGVILSDFYLLTFIIALPAAALLTIVLSNHTARRPRWYATIAAAVWITLVTISHLMMVGVTASRV